MPTREQILLHLNTEIEIWTRRLDNWRDTSMPAYRGAVQRKVQLEAERDRIMKQAHLPGPAKDDPPKPTTRIGENILKLKAECGWSYDQLADKTGIGKKSILSHVNKGVRPRPRILKEYAQAFSRELRRTITAPELEK